MSKILVFTVLLLGGAVVAQSAAANAQDTGRATKIDQDTAQQLSPEQKAVWKGEQNYFRYLQAKDLKSFMALWDDNFIGWPDYSEYPLRKADIELGLKEEFRNVQSSSRSIPPPKPDSIEVFGDVAVTYYFWPEADESSPVKIRVTHTWRKEPGGWRIISGMDCAASRSTSGSAERERVASQQSTSQPAARAGQDLAAAELVTLTNAWTEAINAKDRAKLEMLMAPEYALYSWSGELWAPRAAWLDNLFNHIKINQNTLRGIAPRVYGEFAIVTSVGEWAGTFDGESFNQKTIVVDTWRKMNGRWQVVTRTSHTEDVKSSVKGSSRPDA